MRTFDGFALTADTWEQQRQILLDDLIGKKVENLMLITLYFNFINGNTGHSYLSFQYSFFFMYLTNSISDFASL